MEDITTVNAGKLYRKQQIALWELPDDCLEQIKFAEYPNFFVSCQRTSEDAENTKLSIYPTKHENVYYLVAELEHIIPEVLHEILTLLKENGYDLLSSTGACQKENECFFGVYIAHERTIDMDELKHKVKQIDGVISAKTYRYTFDGCCEV